MKMFDAGKTRMIGLPYGEKNYDDMLIRFHLIPERYGRTDRRTDMLYQYRVNMLTRDKNCLFATVLCTMVRAVLTGRSTVSGFDLAWLISIFRAPLCLRSSWCYIQGGPK